ncbi:Trm112 family protein [SAR202 cluster bacterium AD-802-E10_MRT_200m]|nr:Trm112 family protein [SAR202 cluster bacterium AD-802-E10_MRT_200m]
MRKEITSILACPRCRSSLDLHVDIEEENDVIEGILTCLQCSEEYPITDSIPNLLPPELR